MGFASISKTALCKSESAILQSNVGAVLVSCI